MKLIVILIPLIIGGFVQSAPLSVGAIAPQLTAINQDHQPINLTEKFKSGWTLLYFYPKADTPGCTKQACSLRDNFSELTQKGLSIYGVSTDHPESQKAFQSKYHLPFPLLADSDKKIASAFGVPADSGFAKRMSFLIHDGTIVWTNLAVDVSKHLDEVKAAMNLK